MMCPPRSSGDEHDALSLGASVNLTHVFEHMPVAIALLGQRGEVLFVNRAFERLTGRARAEVLGTMRFEQLCADRDDRDVRSSSQVALSTSSRWTGLLPVYVRDVPLWLEAELSPLPPESGEARYVVTFSDVTDRQRAPASEGSSSDLYLQIFRDNAAIKLLIDPHTLIIIDANPAAASFYGYTVEELRGLSLRALNANTLDQLRIDIEAAERRERNFFRLPHRTRSGELRRVDVFSGPIELGGRRLLLSIVHDVTDRELAEEALARSEARFRTLIELAPVAIAVHRDNKFVYANPALVALLGYERSGDLLDRHVTEIVHPDDRPVILDRIRASTSTGESQPSNEERLLRRDGTRVIAEVMSLPMLFDGQPSVMVVAQNVTERKNLAEQLRRSQRMEAVGRLAGGVAHDFNNLLFVILNAAQFMKRRLPADSDVLHDAEQIQTSAQRAANLTRQLLHFSRGSEPVAEVLDVNKVVLSLRELLERTLGEQIQLRLSVPSQPSLVKLALGNLEQVLVNLAVNARDAMEQGGTLGIEVRETSLDEAMARQMLGLSPGQYVQIVVSDTGTGMSPGVAAQAFEPFFTTKELGGGTGLGLAITYGIVQKAGGHITLDSQLGRGTHVRIHLPRATTLTHKHEETAPMETLRPGQGERILVVEDEGAVRQMLDRILRDSGYEVMLASGPGEALLLAEQQTNPISLLLSDVIMPHMSGPELAERLRKTQPSLRVLYVSGYAGDAITNAGVEVDGMHLLAKPFGELDLLTRIEQVLRT